MMKKILLISGFMLGTVTMLAQTGSLSDKIGVWYKTDKKQFGAGSLNGFLPLDLQKSTLNSIHNLQHDKNNFYVVFNSADAESVELVNLQIRCFSFGIESRPEKMNIPYTDLLHKKINTGAIYKYEFETSVDLKDPSSNIFTINDSKEDRANIYEVLYFKGGLNQPDHQQIQTYLSLKYGVTLLDLGNYVDASGKSIWNQTLNSLTNQEIIGLGHQASFNFTQTESSSSLNGFMKIKLSASSPKIKTDDFILMGGTEHKTIQFQRTTDHAQLLNKNWLVQVNSNSSYVTDLAFDTKDIAGFDAKETYYLLIDRNNSHFDINSATDRIQGKMINKQLVFENIQWDTDHNGYDSFTIAQGIDKKAAVEVELVDRWYMEDHKAVALIPVIKNPAQQTLKTIWYFEGKQVSDQMSFMANRTGNYQLAVTTENGVTETYETQVIKMDNIGVVTPDWTIYPNPVAINESFQIDFGFKEAKNVEVYIYQQNGKFVSRETLGSVLQHSIRTQLNTSGVYFIVAVINGKSEIKRIAVK
ncbi:T9SS type A sorting domain-containing protein [Paenimyroides ceti]